MEWKRNYASVVEGGKKYFTHHEAVTAGPGGREYTFKVSSTGGFMTVKLFWLNIYFGNDIPLVCGVRFFKLKDAKKWAEAFMSSDGVNLSVFQMTGLYS